MSRIVQNPYREKTIISQNNTSLKLPVSRSTFIILFIIISTLICFYRLHYIHSNSIIEVDNIKSKRMSKYENNISKLRGNIEKDNEMKKNDIKNVEINRIIKPSNDNKFEEYKNYKDSIKLKKENIIIPGKSLSLTNSILPPREPSILPTKSNTQDNKINPPPIKDKKVDNFININDQTNLRRNLSSPNLDTLSDKKTIVENINQNTITSNFNPNFNAILNTNLNTSNPLNGLVINRSPVKESENSETQQLQHPTVTKREVIYNSGETACDYPGLDPFKNIPVDSYTPPLKSSIESIHTWEDEVKSMMLELSKMKVGGSILREYMRKEVRRLQELRFKLFCQYV